jgi:hypothetical protein
MALNLRLLSIVLVGLLQAIEPEEAVGPNNTVVQPLSSVPFRWGVLSG